MRFVDGLLMPGWKLYQVLIILALMVVSCGLHHLSDGWVQSWVRSREGWKAWQLRMIVPIRHHLGLVLCFRVAYLGGNAKRHMAFAILSDRIGCDLSVGLGANCLCVAICA